MTIHRERAPGAPLIPITLRWGVILAFGVAIISGVSVFVNGFAVKQLPDAAVYTTLKIGLAALIAQPPVAPEETGRTRATYALPARPWSSFSGTSASISFPLATTTSP